MFTGKKPTDDMFGEEMGLKEWVSEALEQNAATKIMASALLSTEDQYHSARSNVCCQYFNWQ